MRYRVACILLALASLFRALAKMAASKDQSIVVDALTLPGWFVLHDCLIRQQTTKGRVIGFEWKSWPMPEQWAADMKKLKRKN